MAQMKKRSGFSGLLGVGSRGGLRVVMGVVLVACALLVVGLGALGARRSESFVIDRNEQSASSSSASEASGEDDGGSTSNGGGDSADVVVVDVGGAVASPQVVRLSAGARVDDAIQAAGGLTEDADTTSLNRASKIEDGAKVYVPREGETASAGTVATEVGTGATGVSGSVSTSTGSGSSGLVNINTATLEELDTLPGVGPSTAQAIIDDRTQNGPFSSIEDLMRVSGIGDKKFANMKSGITI